LVQALQRPAWQILPFVQILSAEHSASLQKFVTQIMPLVQSASPSQLGNTGADEQLTYRQNIQAIHPRLTIFSKILEIIERLIVMVSSR
jgi:hypothetical protein